MKWIKFIFFNLFLLLIDFFSKYYTYLYIPKITGFVYPYGGIAIFKNFLNFNLSLNYVQNKGAAWGLFSKYTTYLFVFRVLIILLLVIYIIKKHISLKHMMPFGLIIIGAIGNILDYIIYGHVVDMIHFSFKTYSFPVFNFADFFITIGIIWLFFNSTKEEKCK